MTDREKVIEGLKTHLKEISVGKTCFECPYCGNNPCEIHLIADALVLLKKQPEQKHGHWISVDDGDVVALDNDGSPERSCYCSECKEYLVASDEYQVYGRYCPCCGAKMSSEVKQDD